MQKIQLLFKLTVHLFLKLMCGILVLGLLVLNLYYLETGLLIYMQMSIRQSEIQESQQK